MLFTFFFAEIVFPLIFMFSSVFDEENNRQPESIVQNNELMKSIQSMFPDNFTSRYPDEINPYRLKIVGYLIFNLLVKGYASGRTDDIWSTYNINNYYRTVIDSAFYEYLTNFTDRETKDLLFNPMESSKSNLSMSNKEIAIERIGEYLDLLSETRFQSETLNGPGADLHKREGSSTESKIHDAGCDMPNRIRTSGIPEKDFPNYCGIPETSFSCADKRVPGIYADLETACQVFHVCWPRRVDSFLCPIGTTFNQTLLTCDLWYESDCSSSPSLFDRNPFIIDGVSAEQDVAEYDGTCLSLLSKPLRLHAKFLPAKCKVTSLKQSTQETTFKVPSKLVRVDDKLREKMQIAYNLSTDMIEMLTTVRNDLIDELNRMESNWMKKFSKHLQAIADPKINIHATDKITAFVKKLGEIDSESTEQKPSVRDPGSYPIDGILLKQNEQLKMLMKSSKEEVPETVMKSMGLAGTLLSGDIIPLAKQIISDSFRKINSKKH